MSSSGTARTSRTTSRPTQATSSVRTSFQRAGDHRARTGNKRRDDPVRGCAQAPTDAKIARPGGPFLPHGTASSSPMTTGQRTATFGQIVGLLAAACAAQLPGSASQSPLGSPTASSDAPASPSLGRPTASPYPSVGAGFGPDTLAVVVATDGLRVRSLPT